MQKEVHGCIHIHFLKLSEWISYCMHGCLYIAYFAWVLIHIHNCMDTSMHDRCTSMHILMYLSVIYKYMFVCIYIHTHNSWFSFWSYFSSTQMRVIDGSMPEASFAKLALFSRHPEMKGTNFKNCGCFMYVDLLHWKF